MLKDIKFSSQHALVWGSGLNSCWGERHLLTSCSSAQIHLVLFTLLEPFLDFRLLVFKCLCSLCIFKGSCVSDRAPVYLIGPLCALCMCSGPCVSDRAQHEAAGWLQRLAASPCWCGIQSTHRHTWGSLSHCLPKHRHNVISSVSVSVCARMCACLVGLR